VGRPIASAKKARTATRSTESGQSNNGKELIAGLQYDGWEEARANRRLVIGRHHTNRAQFWQPPQVVDSHLQAAPRLLPLSAMAVKEWPSTMAILPDQAGA